ncbi:MAG: hypothetical protein ACKO9Q_15190, partial [Pirellula sp.]
MIDNLSALSPDSRSTYLVRTLWHQAKNQNDLASQVATEWFQKATKVDYSTDLDLSTISDANITFANAIFEASGDQPKSDRTFEAILDRNP